MTAVVRGRAPLLAGLALVAALAACVTTDRGRMDLAIIAADEAIRGARGYVELRTEQALALTNPADVRQARDEVAGIEVAVVGLERTIRLANNAVEANPQSASQQVAAVRRAIDGVFELLPGIIVDQINRNTEARTQ